MTYEWRILDIYSDHENNLVQVRYYLKLKNGNLSVDTEGYYAFSNPIKIYPELSENQVVFMIENDSSQDFVSAIKSRLEEQMQVLQANVQPIRAPWLGPETFAVGL